MVNNYILYSSIDYSKLLQSNDIRCILSSASSAFFPILIHETIEAIYMGRYFGLSELRKIEPEISTTYSYRDFYTK